CFSSLRFFPPPPLSFLSLSLFSFRFPISSFLLSFLPSFLHFFVALFLFLFSVLCLFLLGGRGVLCVHALERSFGSSGVSRNFVCGVHVGMVTSPFHVGIHFHTVVEAQRRLWHFAMGPRLGKLLLKASILVQFLLIRVQSTGRVICKGIRRLILMPYVLEEDHQIFGPNKGESSKPSSEEVY
ncbi:hypothetical protein KC19_1G335300, partial [Ceratodon purpureus]